MQEAVAAMPVDAQMASWPCSMRAAFSSGIFAVGWFVRLWLSPFSEYFSTDFCTNVVDG